MEQQIEKLATKIQKVIAEKVLSNNSRYSPFMKSVFLQIDNRLFEFEVTEQRNIHILCTERIYKADYSSEMSPILYTEKPQSVAYLQKDEKVIIFDEHLYHKLEDIISEIQSELDKMEE